MIDQFTHALFRMINMMMRVAPIGAFGAMAFTIGSFGIETLARLAWLMLGVYTTCLFFIFVVLGIVSYMSGFSILKFLKYIREELFITVGTSSSEAVLPRMMTKLENLGCSKPVVGLVDPAGYSFNLDGTSIYMTMAAIFIAQATNSPLSFAAANRPSRPGDPHVKGQRRYHRRGIRHAGCNPRRVPGRACCRTCPDLRHRPVHVRSAFAHEPDRQRRRDCRCRQVGRALDMTRMNRVLNGEVVAEVQLRRRSNLRR